RATTRQQLASGPDSEQAVKLEEKKSRLRQTVGLLRNLNVVLGIFVLLWAAVLQNIFGLLILR
ncbi:MAG: hypothetical protein D084_Lepto4C00077G0003, partial [Leptospirillum sp. Group IV 'UBA BS']